MHWLLFAAGTLPMAFLLRCARKLSRITKSLRSLSRVGESADRCETRVSLGGTWGGARASVGFARQPGSAGGVGLVPCQVTIDERVRAGEAVWVATVQEDAWHARLGLQ